MQSGDHFTRSFIVQDIMGPMNLSCIAFSPQGNQLAIGALCTVLWDLDRDCELKRFYGSSPAPYNIAFDNTGYLLAVSGDWLIPIWHTQTDGNVLNTSNASKVLRRKGTARTIAFSSDGRFLAAGGYKSPRVVNIWEVSSGKEVYQIENYKDAMKALVFDANTRYVVTGDVAGNVRLWDIQGQRDFWSFENSAGKVRDIAVSSDRSLLAIAYETSVLQVWDFEMRELYCQYRHFSDIRSIKFCPSDWNILAIGGQNNLVTLWNVSDNKMVGRFETTSTVVGIDFSPGGTLLAIASDKGKVYLWQWSESSHGFI